MLIYVIFTSIETHWKFQALPNYMCLHQPYLTWFHCTWFNSLWIIISQTISKLFQNFENISHNFKRMMNASFFVLHNVFHSDLFLKFFVIIPESWTFVFFFFPLPPAFQLSPYVCNQFPYLPWLWVTIQNLHMYKVTDADGTNWLIIYSWFHSLFEMSIVSLCDKTWFTNIMLWLIDEKTL